MDVLAILQENFVFRKLKYIQKLNHMRALRYIVKKIKLILKYWVFVLRLGLVIAKSFSRKTFERLKIYLESPSDVMNCYILDDQLKSAVISSSEDHCVQFCLLSANMIAK